MTAREVGLALTRLGLKDGTEATARAVEQGLAKPAKTRAGAAFYVWRTEDVLAMLGGAPAPAKAPGPDHSAFDTVIATDGSAIRNPGPTGWAWVDQRTGESGAGGLPHGTNNIGEITAVIEALAHVGPEPDLLLRCDSRYVIDMATKWMPGWKRRGWKKGDGKVPENLALVQRLDAALAARTGRTEFEWVRGHAGDPFNEKADELANAQARAFG